MPETPPPWGWDPTSAARLASEIQELGFDSARMVVDRFAQMFERFRSAGEAGPLAEPAVHLRAGDHSFQRVQAEAQRALDSYLALSRRLAEMSLTPFGWGPGGPPPAGALVLPDVSPGGHCSERMWLHNTTDSTVSALRLWTPGLSAHDGSALAPGSVAFDPERVARLDPGASQEIVVTLTVADTGTGLGTYHGQVLVDGLDEVAFPVRVRVVPTGGPT